MDISKTIQKVRDSTVWHGIYDTDTPDEDEDEIEDDDAEDEEEEMEEESSDEIDGNEWPGASSAGNYENTDTVHDVFGYQGLGTFLAGTEVPISIVYAEHDTEMNDFEGQNPEMSSTSQQPQALVDPITASSSSHTLEETFLARTRVVEKGTEDNFKLSMSGELILQSYRHSVTLRPTQDETLPTQCDNILRQELPHDISFPRLLTEYDRLNMLATIPELSLVLVASQIGRVALITITRPVQRDSRLGHIVAMRVDLILPFKDEESVEKIRPSHGLLGMAVGPIQNDRAKKAGKGAGGEGPRRWRLMLHYYNHTILSYEISREEETGELLLI